MTEESNNSFLTDEELARFALQDRKSRRVGLYVTIAIHLLLLLILLFFSIRTMVSGELSFVTDSENEIYKQKQQEEAEKQELIKDVAHQELQEQLDSYEYKNPISIAVNTQTASGSAESNPKESIQRQDASPLDRVDNIKGFDTQVYAIDGEQSADSLASSAMSRLGAEYRGPSVLSWTLDGRRAFSLPIPAYKCSGSGIVTVQIVVGRNGYVKRASVISIQSATDECIKRSALQAAKISRFSTTELYSDDQVGEIVYQFVAQ